MKKIKTNLGETPVKMTKIGNYSVSDRPIWFGDPNEVHYNETMGYFSVPIKSGKVFVEVEAPYSKLTVLRNKNNKGYKDAVEVAKRKAFRIAKKIKLV